MNISFSLFWYVKAWRKEEIRSKSILLCNCFTTFINSSFPQKSTAFPLLIKWGVKNGSGHLIGVNAHKPTLWHTCQWTKDSSLSVTVTLKKKLVLYVPGFDSDSPLQCHIVLLRNPNRENYYRLRGGIIIKKIAQQGRMWQRAYRFFFCAYICRAMQRNLCFII